VQSKIREERAEIMRIKKEKADKKKERFGNMNMLAKSRIKDSTWLHDKNGDLKYYDRVGWPEEALQVSERASLLEDERLLYNPLFSLGADSLRLRHRR